MIGVRLWILLFFFQTYCCLWPHHVWLSFQFPEGFSPQRSRRCGCGNCLYPQVSSGVVTFFWICYKTNLDTERVLPSTSKLLVWVISDCILAIYKWFNWYLFLNMYSIYLITLYLIERKCIGCAIFLPVFHNRMLF